MMTRVVTSLMLLLLMMMLVGGCYTPSGAFIPVSDFEAPSSGDQYLVLPGDVLQVRVFQQEAMSARVKVRADGKISLPFVNEVLVAGKAPAVIAAELQGRLKEFVNTPVVTVSLEETRPLTVSVVGEVVRPGTVTLELGAGVLQAIAGAGGLTDFAQKEGIFVLRTVLRDGRPQPVRVRFTWEELTRGAGKAARFALVAGDVVVAE
jgi:polysaccharide biosynthesis/export protein